MTYTFGLQPGNNVIALPLVPEATSTEDVLADVLPVLTLLQDDGGSYFVPSQGINALPTWDWSEAYRMHVVSARSFSVSGLGIVPEASPLILEEGPNWVPYLRNGALPIREALATIASSLLRVEDANGHVYEPDVPESTLDWLLVGHGYRVWVGRRDTLYYPANTLPGNGASEAGTITQALAFTGLEVGQEIEVLGYYTPGDGGGGRFLVEASGAAPDGGTIFVPDEHATGTIVEVLPNTQNTRYLSVPPDSRLVYGSVSVDVLHPDTGEPIVTIDGRDLHGHEWVSRFQAKSVIDYANSGIDDRRQRMAKECERVVGGLWDCALRIRYRYTTSPIRLHRQGVARTLNADWFGACTHDEDPAFDNQPVLAHLINLANAKNRENPGSITTIHLPKPAVYEYFGSLQLGDGLTLRGAGGTELATVTNDLGHTYHPVRLKSLRTTLRVKDGEALKHIRMEKEASDPSYLPPDVKEIMHDRKTAINIANGATSAGLRDIVLDGNWEGNQQAWMEGWATFDEKEANMRNTPGWSGFISTDHGGVYIPQGQEITLRDVAILGYAATGVLGNVDNTWVTENVRLGNALWNHALYGTNGTWTNLTFEGFAWTHAAWYAGEISNLVFEDGAPAPYRSATDLIAIRGGDAYADEDVLGRGSYTHEDGTVLSLGTTIDGFYLDLRGSGITQPFGGIGPRIALRNGIVIEDENENYVLFSEGGNGYQKALYPGYAFENITVYRNGAANGGVLFGKLSVTESVFRNITTDETLLGATNRGNRSLTLQAGWRDHYAWDQPQTVTFEDIHSDAPTHFIARASIKENAAGIEVFIRNSRFNNTTNTVIAGPDDGTGTLDQMEGQDLDKLRVLMDNVAFNLYGSYLDNMQVFLALTYFHNSVDMRSGRTSEDSGTVSFTANGGETRANAPTNLFWVPQRAEYVTVDGSDASLVTSIRPVCPDGRNAFGLPTNPDDDRRGCSLRFTFSRPLDAGEEVSFGWEAAVRPWPED